MRDDFVLLERKVIDPSNAVTKIKFGRMVIQFQSAFSGKKEYAEILGGIVERRICQASIDERWGEEFVERQR